MKIFLPFIYLHSLCLVFTVLVLPKPLLTSPCVDARLTIPNENGLLLYLSVHRVYFTFISSPTSAQFPCDCANEPVIVFLFVARREIEDCASGLVSFLLDTLFYFSYSVIVTCTYLLKCYVFNSEKKYLKYSQKW